MPAGRPTKYKGEETLKQVDEYLALCVDEYTEFHRTRGDKSNTYERLVNVKIPTIEGLALHLDVHKDTLYEWQKHHPRFSDSLGKVMDVQAERLKQGSLSGSYNSTIAKLMLMNNHGMTEKKDVTSGGEKLPTPIMPLDE